jgi:hypothetical protein
VKRILAALAGIAGIAWWKSRTQPQADPAEELRTKLAAARAADDRDEFESGETPVDQAPDVDTRRREVHDRARAQIDELSHPGE